MNVALALSALLVQSSSVRLPLSEPPATSIHFATDEAMLVFQDERDALVAIGKFLKMNPDARVTVRAWARCDEDVTAAWDRAARDEIRAKQTGKESDELEAQERYLVAQDAEVDCASARGLAERRATSIAAMLKDRGARASQVSSEAAVGRFPCATVALQHEKVAQRAVNEDESPEAVSFGPAELKEPKSLKKHRAHFHMGHGAHREAELTKKKEAKACERFLVDPDDDQDS